MNRISLTAEVYRAAADLCDWVVWASNPYGDGEVYVTTFSGPDAEARALEYAAAKYAGLLRHEPEQQPIRAGTLRIVSPDCNSQAPEPSVVFDGETWAPERPMSG